MFGGKHKGTVHLVCRVFHLHADARKSHKSECEAAEAHNWSLECLVVSLHPLEDVGVVTSKLWMTKLTP